MTAPAIERAPGFVPEVEALLGTRAFYDDERNRALRAGTMTFTAESAGMRGLLYVRSLRLMTQASREGKFDMDAPDPRHQLGQFALEHLPEAGDIARQLAVINTAEHMLNEREDVFLGGLRSHQPPYMHDIVGFMNTVPQEITYSPQKGQTRRAMMHGALVEAPTGLGKTVLMARALVATGVGQPIENIEHDRRPVRALIIVPTQTLIEQMTGKVGDDTLRKFAPGVQFGAYYQHEQDSSADAVVITIDQFVEKFRNGMLDGQRFDICIIDEAHRATQPRFQQVLVEHWGDKPVIGFTATPEYHKMKDARQLLPHRIFHGDILDYITSEEDVLNAAQLFEIRADYDRSSASRLRSEGMSKKDTEQLVVREATAEFLEPAIAEGRRGMIFCEQGGDRPSGYAIKMAELLSRIKKPDGTNVQCAVAGSLKNHLPQSDPESNAGIRRRYAAGKLDFIVTVDWGREGLNEDIDIVVTAGKITSKLKFMQEIGRGTRLSKRFPVSVYAHIFVPTMDRDALSLFGLFGLETIEQGLLLGVVPNRRPPKRGYTKREKTAGLSTEDFSPRMQELIESIQLKSVGEALFDAESTLALPKEFVNFADIMHDVPGPPITIRKYLRDKQGFRCIGRYEQAPGGGRPFVFYFEPAAKEYLDTYRGAVARTALQKEFGGVDVSIVDDMATAVEAKQLHWFYQDGKFIVHYSREHTQLIREEFKKTPPARPTDYNRARLAAAIGISNSALAGRLLPNEWALSIPKRTTTADGKIRVLSHWSEKVALRIIERFKNQEAAEGTLPYLVPYDLVARFVNIDKARLITFAENYGEPTVIVRIAQTGRPPRCVLWSVMKAAQVQYGLRKTANFTINYDLLPSGPQDRDPAKIKYAADVVRWLRDLPSKVGR